jgi:hypothetical protein
VPVGPASTAWPPLTSRVSGPPFAAIGRRSHRGCCSAVGYAHVGRQFLLVHRLLPSHRTGELIKPIFLRFSFPPRWHYDILRALDYFQTVNARGDQRLANAVEIDRNKQREDGCWPLKDSYRGKTHFELERLDGPSRWNTLRALRVLKWWNGAAR